MRALRPAGLALGALSLLIVGCSSSSKSSTGGGGGAGGEGMGGNTATQASHAASTGQGGAEPGVCHVGDTQKCDQDESGKKIDFPGGSAQGECKQGTQTCTTDHGVASWGACEGAIGPSTRDCNSSKDNDCDGKPDNTHDTTCVCSTSDSPACTAGPGNCMGTRMCQVESGSSTWSTCQAPDHCDCTDGMNRACNVAACSGTQACAGGQWGPCQSGGQTLPASCQCVAGQTQSCGGSPCAVSQACNDFAYPACPVPADCTCKAPGQGFPCQNPLDYPCTTTSCGADYKWNGSTTCTAPQYLYRDADGDGYGNPSIEQKVCPGPGWVSNNTDCNDQSSGVHALSYASEGVSNTCVPSFTDAIREDFTFDSCGRSGDYDVAVGGNWTFNFRVSQSGNVGTDGTVAASVCCSSDTRTPNGACVNVTAAQFQAGSTLSVTCTSASTSLIFVKETNAGGFCCGGYTRNIIPISFSNYPHCP